MVAHIPLPLAAADALYAGGLGLVLAAVYSFLRMVLPTAKPIVLFCDILVFVLGAILYYSAAMARFYSGIPRWYTMAALLAGYLAWRLCLHPSLHALSKVLETAFCAPFKLLWHAALRPLFLYVKGKSEAHRAKSKAKRKKAKIKHAKQLQNPSQVLYNSK